MNHVFVCTILKSINQCIKRVTIHDIKKSSNEESNDGCLFLQLWILHINWVSEVQTVNEQWSTTSRC